MSEEDFTPDELAEYEALVALDDARNDFAIWQDRIAGLAANAWETTEPTSPLFAERMPAPRVIAWQVAA
jgi:hypothetical protein